ncbi:MAG: CHAT domain-containing protein [Pseudomarimonas sp.]
MSLFVRGAPLPDALLRRGSLFELGTIKPEVMAGVDLSAGQRAGSSGRLDVDGLGSSDTFCEVELEDGTLLWLRPSELRDSPYFETASQRDGAVELVPARRANRGLGQAVARVLKVFKLDPVKIAAGIAREKLVAHFERDVVEGLFQVGAQPADLQPIEAKRFAGNLPCLLMLHGTFSSTVGSFGSLHSANGGERWRRLTASFGQRMLALDHRSMSVSPLRNALDVAKALPGGLRLHLLSHSRGGLIGELLSRHDGKQAGFRSEELALLDALDGGLAAEARELNLLLSEKKFRVERFVRVACPARGTTGVSERAREWLTVIANMLARFFKAGADSVLPAAGGAALIPVARRVVDLLEAVTLELIKFNEIPGLHAMDPRSGFIRGLINSESARSMDQLAVIAGDAEGEGLFGRLKMFAVDRFFERDNDLVVDTASMMGGAQREHAYRFLARGPDISHTTYFGNPRTSDVITKALTASAIGELAEFSRSAVDQQPLRSPLRTPASRSNRADLPVLFLLPGIMGTHLTVAGDPVWVDKWELVRGGFARLAVDAPDVELAQLDGDTYQSLADALAADHEVVPFPYDWRLSIDSAAKLLNQVVRAKLAEIDGNKRPIRFVAHSMGGLVVRAMMMLPDSVWPEVRKHPDARFVMLGTPNQGSHAISLLLTGNDKLVKLLAVADMKNNLAEIVGFAAGFPGALDMTPTTGERDYFTQQAWLELASAKQLPHKWPLPEQKRLDSSRAFRDRLAQQDLANAGIYYIAGKANDTPVSAELKPGGDRPRLRFLATREGDGRVPWASGIPKGVKAWYVPAKHGSIPRYRHLHAGLREILNTGNTQLLADTPPVSRGLAGELHEYAEQHANYLPDAGDLLDAAMYAQDEPERIEDEPLPPIDVQVIWGNLRYAKEPVVVGHYVGDQIVSAEKALDRFLDGALNRRLALGRYPGEIGTALVMPNPRGELPGAVVIGLGQVSMRLTRVALTRAVQAGVCEWAARMLEAKSTNKNSPELGTSVQRGLAFVAIGSGSGGMSISDVGVAILNGVERALELLAAQRGMEEVKRLGLARIQFLELYEDRAHTLWFGLTSQQEGNRRDAPLAPCFHVGDAARGVSVGEGGLRRLVLQELDGWWNPLKITQDGNRVVFESIGDRARAELHGVGTHSGQINELLRQAVASRQSSSAFAKALFELMIPNDLKDSLPSGDRLRLLVDGKTARYPWELILAGQQANDPSAEACGLGLIRQFVTERFRPSPRMSQEASALVVGDPHTHNEFIELPGALSEANAVHATLGELGFTMPSSPLRDHLSILTALYARPYQVLHLAGHGIESLRDWLLDKQQTLGGPRKEMRADRLASLSKAQADVLAEIELDLSELDELPISAMVIGPRRFLTYRNIEQMRQVPELVFINCCHLGKIDTPTTRAFGQQGSTAANFAQKFIEIGVRVVIAAGWPVEDAAACTFAEAFYRQMRSGAPFGEAVRIARETTRHQHADSNTWSAYQCYGDPSYRLTATKGQLNGGAAGTPVGRYGSPRHLAWEGVHTADTLETLANRIAYAEANGFDADGELCGEIAARYRQFKAFPEAIRWYRRGLLSEKGSTPIKGIEQLTNLIARSGATIASKGQKPDREWIKQLDAAVDMLKKFNEANPSRERHSIIASAYKRKAMALSGKQRDKALQASADAYKEAADMAGKKGHPYAFINAAVLLGAQAWANATTLPSKEIKDLILEAENRVPAPGATPDFWDLALPGDLLALKLFVNAIEPSDELIEEISTLYSDAHERDRDKANLASVLDQLEFMVDVLGRVQIAAQLKNAKSRQRALESALACTAALTR